MLRQREKPLAYEIEIQVGFLPVVAARAYLQAQIESCIFEYS